MMQPHVYITGASMLSSHGIGNKAVWESAISGKDTQEERSYRMSDGQILRFPVYPVRDLRLSDWAAPNVCSWLAEESLHDDRDFVLLLAAVQLALEDAGLGRDALASAALIVGHENLGVNRLIDRILASPAILRSNPENGDPFSEPMASFEKWRNDFFKLQSFPYLFYLAKAFGIGGLSYTVNNACASGLYALELGSQLIKCKQADTVVVVCADYAHVTEHLWLGQKGFGSKAGRLRPFDQDRDGSILGDGAAAVILQSSRQAARSRHRPLGRYLGGSFRQDGWQLALPDVTARSYSYVITDAIRRFSKGSVDLLIPHGAGIKLWDLYESREIRDAFSSLALPLPAITALKGYFGHTLGANSLLETVFMLYCMQHNLIPPALHYERFDPHVGLTPATESIEKQIKTAVKTVSAYGGFQAAAVFEKV